MENAKAKNHRSLWLELFKIFLFVCVAFIHVGYSKTFLYLARVAVLMFFVISGCYCYSPKKENESDEEYYERKLRSAKKKIISMLKYIVFGYVVYYIRDIIAGFILGKNLAEIFKGFFNADLINSIFIYNHVHNSGGHMWFLLALLTDSIIHYLLVKFRIEKAYFFLPLLIVVFFLFAVYLQLIEGDLVWGDMTRNGLFLGLPCWSLGFDVNYLITKYIKAKKQKIIVACISLPLALLLFFLQLIEQKMLGFNAEAYISGFLSTPFFMAFFLICPSPNPKWYEFIFGKNLAFYAFIFHAGVGYALSDFGIGGPTKTWLVIAISLALGILINLIVILIKFIVRKIRKDDTSPMHLSVN